MSGFAQHSEKFHGKKIVAAIDVHAMNATRKTILFSVQAGDVIGITTGAVYQDKNAIIPIWFQVLVFTKWQKHVGTDSLAWVPGTDAVIVKEMDTSAPFGAPTAIDAQLAKLSNADNDLYTNLIAGAAMVRKCRLRGVDAESEFAIIRATAARLDARRASLQDKGFAINKSYTAPKIGVLPAYILWMLAGGVLSLGIYLWLTSKNTEAMDNIRISEDVNTLLKAKLTADEYDAVIKDVEHVKQRAFQAGKSASGGIGKTLNTLMWGGIAFLVAKEIVLPMLMKNKSTAA